MNEISINFHPLSNKGMLALAAKVHHALTTAPAIDYFPDPQPSLPQLKELHDLFAAALAQETSISVSALRRSRRKDLIKFLIELSVYLELRANGDMMKLAATGFNLKKKPIRSGAATGIPENLRAAITGISGQLLARCKAVPGARTYHAQYALSPDGPWIDIDPVSSSQKILFKGLPRGKDVYIRVRAFGPNGYSGWSDIAVVMVV